MLIFIECIIGILGHKVSSFIPKNLGIWFSFDIAFIGAAFVNAGRLIFDVFHEITIRVNNIILICMASVMSLATFFISNLNQPKDSWVTIMAWGEYGKNFALFFINACLATFAMLLVAYCLNNLLFIANLGKNSLLIMAYHYILFPYTIKISRIICGGNIMILGCMIFPVLNALFVLLIGFPINLFINRFIPNLSGKNIDK